MRKVYGVDRHPKGRWWDNDVHEPLCHWLQTELEAWLARRSDPTPQRTFLGALLPRAAAKTNLITKAAMMWLQLRNPELSCYIGNEKLENAIDFLGVIKAHLEGSDDFSWWTWLYGNWRSNESRWRQDGVTHAARTTTSSEASFGIVSMNTGLTGKHPDIVCLDDLVSYEGLSKDAGLYETAASFMGSLIPVIEPNGLMILVGTRYSDADPFGHAIRTLGIQSLSGMQDPDYPVTPAGRWRFYFMSARYPDGRPSIPSVWPEQAMQEYKQQDPIKYAYQVLNRPKESPFRPLTEAQFDRQIVRDHPKYLRVSLHLDTAFKHLSRYAVGCESAIVAIGHDPLEKGVVYFLGAWHSPAWTSEQFNDRLIEVYRDMLARELPVKCITDELESYGKSGVYGKHLTTVFRQVGLTMPTFLTFNRLIQGERKDARISEAITYVVKGLVHFWAGAPGLATIRYQLCNHPDSSLKDVADAFADFAQDDVYTVMLPHLTLEGDKPEDFLGPWEDTLKRPGWWKAHEKNEYDTLIDNDPDFTPEIYDRQPV